MLGSRSMSACLFVVAAVFKEKGILNPFAGTSDTSILVFC